MDILYGTIRIFLNVGNSCRGAVVSTVASQKESSWFEPAAQLELDMPSYWIFLDMLIRTQDTGTPTIQQVTCTTLEVQFIISETDTELHIGCLPVTERTLA